MEACHLPLDSWNYQWLEFTKKGIMSVGFHADNKRAMPLNEGFLVILGCQRLNN